MLNITSKRRISKKNIELNIAPLIDMIFILLIFFLVTTSFVKETGVDINRPVASSASSKNKANILIGITRDNRIFMDRREIDIRTVRANVERALAENPESAVIIVADEKSETGVVIRVMDSCKLAGAKNVALAATPPSGGSQ
jgi:biopolymer transport protein ExbD